MAALRSIGTTLGVLALAGAAFVAGQQCATRSPGGPPGERVRAALANPDPIARATALVPVLRDLQPSQLADVEEAYLASFAANGPSDTAIALLGEASAALDPAGALDRVASWPPGQRLTAQKALLRAWARRNRTAALEWLAGMPDDGTFAEAAFGGWAESNDPEMWDRVAEMPQGMQREAASMAMMQWIVAREGVDALFTRVETLPDDAPNEFKFAAIGTATSVVAEHDPVRALAFADRHAQGPYARGMLQRIAVRWVVRDAPAAMQALLDRPASEDRDHALRETYITWLRRDHAAALAWMPESAPLDARYAALVSTYAVAVANNDLDHRGEAIRQAIRWTEQAPEGDARRAAFVQLGVLWLYYEPEAARPWLAQNGLEPEVRAETARYERIRQALSGARAR